MSEIKCRRWKMNNQQSRAHLFLGDNSVALCGSPKKSPDKPREWELVPDPKPGDVCWACLDRRRLLEQDER